MIIRCLGGEGSVDWTAENRWLVPKAGLETGKQLPAGDFESPVSTNFHHSGSRRRCARSIPTPSHAGNGRLGNFPPVLYTCCAIQPSLTRSGPVDLSIFREEKIWR